MHEGVEMNLIQIKQKQGGFTIIELVVVILLLGILTATALPRFLNLATEAHDAVLDGVEGGLRTGVALYHAQWNGQGRPAAGTQIVTYDNLRVNSTGFPGGSGCDNGAIDTTACAVDGTDGTFTESVPATAHTECLNVYFGLLQLGAPSIEASADAAIGAFDQEDDITGASSDFVAKLTSNGVCSYAYVGDSARTTAGTNLQGFTYSAVSGLISRVSNL